MHRTPTGWRAVGRGFAPVPQTDDGDDGSNPERRSIREFRNQVQQVLRQTASNRGNDQGSAHASPAFSDTTLVAGDYLDVPIRHYEELDIGDYVEYHGEYYGPEAASLSPTPSTKAGLGLEVHSWPVALSPGGLYVDDPWNNISYRGSEGKIEEEIPREPRNYKPSVLRGMFLVTLFLVLSILVVLAGLAIQLLPKDSGVIIPFRVNGSTAEIHRRSDFAEEIGPRYPLAFFKRQNSTNPNGDPSAVAPSASSTSTSAINTMTATQDLTTASHSTSILETVVTGSTSADSSQASTQPVTKPAVTQPSETQPLPSSLTSQATSFPSPSSSQPETDITSPPPASSLTTTSPQTEPSAPSPPPPPPLPPPPVTSPSEDSTQPPYTQTSAPPSTPISLPGHEEPAPSQGASSSSDTLVPTASSVSSLTDGVTITSQTGNPWPWPTSSHPGDPTKPDDPQPDPTTFTSSAWPSASSSTISDGNTPPFTSTSPPVSLPTDPDGPHPGPTSSTSRTGPPFSWPTGPDSSTTNPTLNLPTLTSSTPPPPPPPISTSSGGPSPDPPTVSTTSSTNLPLSSLITTSDPTSTTTLAPSSAYNTDSSSANTNLPWLGSSSTPPSSSVEAVTSTKEAPASDLTSIGSSTTANTISSPTSHLSGTSSPSHSELYGVSTTSNVTEPFTTITKSADEQTISPPITTTIVTSMTQSNGVFIETTQVSIIHPVKADVDDSVTDYAITYTDSNGRLTTETGLAQASTETIILEDEHGKPTSTETVVLLRHPMQTTLTDYQGRATKTESYYLGESTEVLYDKDHHPTATRTATITEIISLITLTGSNGLPTETLTEIIPLAPTSSTTTLVVNPISTASPNSEGNKTLHVVPISDGKYFLGLMFPTFVAIVVSIPIRILDQTAKLYQPFHVLASGGGQARDTLLFQTAGICNFTERFRSLLNGQILLTLTGLLVLGSVIIIPLSSEAVRLILEGPDCAAAKGDTFACRIALGIYPVPAYIAVAIIAFMVVLVALTTIVLWRWNTGLDWNPWSIYHMGHLAANNEVRTLLQRRLREKNGRITHKQAKKAFGRIPFIIDYWKDNGALKYSILIPNEAHSLKKDGRSVAFGKGKASRQKRKGDDTVPFFILTWTGRLLFLVLLCAAMIGLLIYTIMGDDEAYTRLAKGEWRVVRFIFTSIGVLISLIWGCFFYAVAFISPHKLLRRIRLYNIDAVHMTPPTNPFSGVRSSLTRGRRDVYLGLVSATAILSEILPLLLSTALDRCTEYFWAHTVCLWMAVSVLSIMILTVSSSFFVAWPHMPIDPSTIGGGMYYALTTYMPMSPSSGLLFGRASPGLV
ncbi:hypothetical protein F5Y05DRAFT_380326 [Hypoxylon sp. FL0543]|nr:hypothetical protein F5Y05DRAFT_380326 [Hypoxylon sp. FL0543]